MSDILETMLAAVPDSYQKTVGFPIYDILAAAALRMGGWPTSRRCWTRTT